MKGFIMITIREIAKLAGVSRGTVDRVLNNRTGVNAETSRIVRQIAEEHGYSPSAPGKMLAAKSKHLKIGFIVCDRSMDIFFHSLIKAAEQKAEELKSFGVKVNIYKLKKLSDTYVEDVLRQVEEDKLDGIAMLPLQLPAVDGFIKRMKERNTPLVFFNLNSQEEEGLAYVGCDYYEAGRVAAGLIALSIGNKGKIVIATSYHKETLSFSERLNGFIDELDREYPEIEIVNRDEDYIFQEDDYSNILKVLSSNPDVKALYLVNPGDYGLCKAVAGFFKDHRVKIITNDLVEEKMELLMDGTISAAIGQEPLKQGTLPLQILYDYLSLGVIPEKQYITNLSIHIKQNAYIA